MTNTYGPACLACHHPIRAGCSDPIDPRIHYFCSHRTIVREGRPGESNYVVVCTCGKRAYIATTDPTFAERSRAEHAKSHEIPVALDDPFIGLPR